MLCGHFLTDKISLCNLLDQNNSLSLCSIKPQHKTRLESIYKKESTLFNINFIK